MSIGLWILLFMPLVVSHYSVLPLEVTTTQKCHRYMRWLLKSAIRYLKNAIALLDVFSKMPLDIVILTSNPLTMLYDKNKHQHVSSLYLTMISVAPLVRSKQANIFTGK